jgi:predicted small lipoprotein YifL
MTMKKLIALLLAVLMVAALAACGAEPPKTTEPAAQEQTDPTKTTEPEVTDPAPAEEVFSFTYEGVELVPGAAFDPAQLPEADSVFEVPSCAIEGTDNVYSYPPFELTAYNDGTGEVIYSIYLLDANTPTAEGLYVGDDLARVTELYGSDYTENDTELTFTKGNTTLNLILDGETVISIEYRMAV